MLYAYLPEREVADRKGDCERKKPVLPDGGREEGIA